MKKIVFISLCSAFLAFASCNKYSDIPEPYDRYQAPQMPYFDFTGKYKSVSVRVNGFDATSIFTVNFAVQLDSVMDKKGRVEAYKLPAVLLTSEIHPLYSTVVKDTVKSLDSRFLKETLLTYRAFEMGEWYTYEINCVTTSSGEYGSTKTCDQITDFRSYGSFRYEKNVDNSLSFTRLVGGIKHEYRLVKQ